MIDLTCLRCGNPFQRRPSMVGRFCSHRCASTFNKNINATNLNKTGEKNYLWKGAEASYGAIHSWVRRWKGKPATCFMCNGRSGSRFEWANVSGQYLRDLDDYVSLCASCHRTCDRLLRYGYGY